MGTVMNKAQPVDAARPGQRRDQEMPRETAPGKTSGSEKRWMPGAIASGCLRVVARFISGVAMP